MTELKHLGKNVPLPEAPSKSILDAVPNPHPGVDYVVRFTCPEMTSICPATGQPDFATIIIDYAPNKFLVESKSLKLYTASYRNHKGFHEDCTIQIGLDIKDAVDPDWLRIAGFWFPRGGIPIDVFWEYGKRPDCTIPDWGVPTYHAR